MENKSSCNMINCLISVIAVAVFLNFFGMFVHVYLLMDDYLASAELWRSEEEMEAIGPWWMVYYLIIATAITCLFKQSCKNNPNACSTRCPIKSGGVCFGVILGVLMGTMMGSAYIYMPIPIELAVKWFITGFVAGLGSGIILGVVYKPNTCSTESK